MPIKDCKTICQERRCGWQGMISEVLCDANPFDRTDNIYGCPKCKAVQEFCMACDEPGCWLPVCAGTPTLDGYRQTCGTHIPQPIVLDKSTTNT